jgi:hypothetical protein
MARRFELAVRWSIGVLVAGAVVVAGSVLAAADSSPEQQAVKADQELARLLVKLEKRTRQVIAEHYSRPQAGGSEATSEYKQALIENRILPAAVADPIFSEVVPSATGGRAWVRMVVPEPRNPNNRGDTIALELIDELAQGPSHVERDTGEAYYYGEPIVAKAGCLVCHGTPAGEPDPYFSQFSKNGWEPGQVVGGVVARVARAPAD